MRTYLAAVAALMLGATPAIGDAHVRYVVHSENRARTSTAAREELPGPARALNLRIYTAPITPKPAVQLHPRAEPAPVRSSRFDRIMPPPSLRVDFLTQSHTDDEPSAFNSVSSSLYKQLPSTQTQSGVHIITTPQLIKSADGRLLGAGITANF